MNIALRLFWKKSKYSQARRGWGGGGKRIKRFEQEKIERTSKYRPMSCVCVVLKTVTSGAMKKNDLNRWKKKIKMLHVVIVCICDIVTAFSFSLISP